MFVGAVSDNFDERIDQKIFHAEFVVNVAKVSAETKDYEPIPIIADFKNETDSDNLQETIEANYKSQDTDYQFNKPIHLIFMRKYRSWKQEKEKNVYLIETQDILPAFSLGCIKVNR